MKNADNLAALEQHLLLTPASVDETVGNHAEQSGGTTARLIVTCRNQGEDLDAEFLGGL